MCVPKHFLFGHVTILEFLLGDNLWNLDNEYFYTNWKDQNHATNESAVILHMLSFQKDF